MKILSVKLKKKQASVPALVDDDIYAIASKMKWHLSRYDYPCTSIWKGTTIFLHHLVMGTPIGEWIFDHANRNKLDNQRSNLRPATRKQNQANRDKQKNNTSGFKGVFWHDGRHKWEARISNIYLGLFRNKEDAARAYNEKAKELHGDFAKLNEV